MIKTCQSGPSNGNWKGGRKIERQGYVLVYSPNHPRKTIKNTMREHILVAEKTIGRYLKKGT